MVLVALACVASAWLGSEWQFVRKRRAVLQKWQAPGYPIVLPTPLESTMLGAAKIPWHRRLMGDRPVSRIMLGSSMPDEDSELAKKWFPEARVGVVRPI
jgi:hypothetical protein